jgi:hypothetical protein
MTDGTVSTNSAAGYGGGIYNFGPMTLTRCTVTANDAGTGGYGGFGGGISQTHGNATLDNSTVSNNTARLEGGGISYDGGTLSLTNGSRVTGNHAGIDGGGIMNRGTVACSGSAVSANTKGASNLTSNCVNTGSGTGCGTCPV